jgi:hypothetical protein
VCLYECAACGGLWLRLLNPGSMINIREENLPDVFPGMTLQPFQKTSD